MAYTFLKAEGFTVGKSLVEDSMLQTALEIKKRAEEKGIQFLLPTDHQVVDSYEPVKGDKIVTKTIPIEFTNIGHAGMDIGVETCRTFSAALQDARMIIWNGPMGVFEEPPFDQGTIGVAKAVAEAAERGAIVVIVGGGDSVSAVTRAGVADRSHTSQPVAARRWNSSPARTSPASKRSTINSDTHIVAVLNSVWSNPHESLPLIHRSRSRCPPQSC